MGGYNHFEGRRSPRCAQIDPSEIPIGAAAFARVLPSCTSDVESFERRLSVRAAVRSRHCSIETGQAST
jgi:hypothetical protein